MRIHYAMVPPHELHQPWVADVAAVLERVEYRDWVARIGYDCDDAAWLQLEFIAPDEVAGFVVDGVPQRGRKWRISRHMTPEEIIQTALLAVLTAEEHEARERFRVDGLAIFNPHISLLALLARAESTVRRTPELPLRGAP